MLNPIRPNQDKTQFIPFDPEGLNRDDAPSQHIIIKRSRLVEDGFQMLSPFTARELRQTIRVKFYNDLGKFLK